MYYGAILEVLPGDDSRLRDMAMRNKGEPGSTGIGLVCALSPDGTCRLCDVQWRDPFSCDQGTLGGYSDHLITFQGSQLSHRLVLVGGDIVTSVVGTYEKVDDDPGPLPVAGTEPAPPPAEPTPLPATSGSATASSSGRRAGYTASPDQAIDGDNETFWCATSVPAWFRWDLGRSRRVSSLSVDVYYHTVHGNVEVSTGSSSWAVPFDTTASDIGSGIDDSERKTFRVDDDRLVEGAEHGGGRAIRYVQIDFTQTDAPGSDTYKACISEVQYD